MKIENSVARFLIIAGLIGLVFLGSACRHKEIGVPCERKGDGFQTRHSCANKCLAWSVTCGDGTEVAAPHICSGEQNCSLRKPCPGDQVCAVSGGNNYCVPLSLCPSGVPTSQPTSEEVLKQLQEKKQKALKLQTK